MTSREHIACNTASGRRGPRQEGHCNQRRHPEGERIERVLSDPAEVAKPKALMRKVGT